MTETPETTLANLENHVRQAVKATNGLVTNEEVKQALKPLVKFSIDLGDSFSIIAARVNKLGVRSMDGDPVTRNAVIGWKQRWYKEGEIPSRISTRFSSGRSASKRTSVPSVGKSAGKRGFNPSFSAHPAGTAKAGQEPAETAVAEEPAFPGVRMVDVVEDVMCGHPVGPGLFCSNAKAGRTLCAEHRIQLYQQSRTRSNVSRIGRFVEVNEKGEACSMSSLYFGSLEALWEQEPAREPAHT